MVLVEYVVGPLLARDVVAESNNNCRSTYWPSEYSPQAKGTIFHYTIVAA